MTSNVDRSFDRSRSEFAARKAKVAMSNAELSRRTGLSVNTIKTYIAGDPVRESTVQRLHEALDIYVFEREAIAAGKDVSSSHSIASGGNDADALEAEALSNIELATTRLREADKLRSRERSKIGDAVRREIEREIGFLEVLIRQ